MQIPQAYSKVAPPYNMREQILFTQITSHTLWILKFRFSNEGPEDMDVEADQAHRGGDSHELSDV